MGGNYLGVYVRGYLSGGYFLGGICPETVLAIA